MGLKNVFLKEVSWVGLRLRLVSELCSPMSSSLDGLIFFSGQRFPYKSRGHGILDKQRIRRISWEP